MSPALTRYLLFTDTAPSCPEGPTWRFLLHAVDDEQTISASDSEPGLRPDRLALMAVVRGLEALDSPASVKLVTTSPYVRRGITRGISEWRSRGWKWERFGRLATVRDADLWRRVDQALAFHRVECRGWHAESPAHSSGVMPRSAARQAPAADRVIHRGINEPAVLIVRGNRRHVFDIAGRGGASRLAAAG